MPLTFDVDGKRLKDPTSDDIAGGFASISAVGTHDISVIELGRPPVILCAFGNPTQGYTLDIRETLEPKGTETSKVTSPAKLLPHEEVVRIFQAFARGDDSWQAKFHWEPGLGTIPAGRAYKHLAVMIIGFVLLVLVLKYVLKLF